MSSQDRRIETQTVGRIFRCPKCFSNLNSTQFVGPETCDSCGLSFSISNGVPVLLKDRASIETLIETAKSQGRADWYEAEQTTQLKGPYRHHFKRRRDFVESIIENYRSEMGSELIGLDIGTGDGVNTLWLSKYFSKLYASDYNLLRLLRAAKLGSTSQVFVADINDYPVRDSTFDVIFFNHVLEHIPDDDRALSEVYRILKPGGLLVLGVPNEGAAFWQLAYKLQPETLRTTDHVHFYTAETLSKKCLNAQFKVQQIYPIGWGIPHWGLDARVKGHKWVDDLFEKLGRAVLPSQCTSLYLILSK